MVASIKFLRPHCTAPAHWRSFTSDAILAKSQCYRSFEAAIEPGWPYNGYYVLPGMSTMNDKFWAQVEPQGKRIASVMAMALLVAPVSLLAEPAPLIALQDGPQVVSWEESDPVLNGVRTKFLEFDAPAMAGLEIAVEASGTTGSLVHIERRMSSDAWQAVDGTAVAGGWSGSLVDGAGRYRIVIVSPEGALGQFTVIPQMTPPARNRIPIAQSQTGHISTSSLRAGGMRMQSYSGKLKANHSYRIEADSEDFPVVLIGRLSDTDEELTSANDSPGAVLNIRAARNEEFTLMVASANATTGTFRLTFEETEVRAGKP